MAQRSLGPECERLLLQTRIVRLDFRAIRGYEPEQFHISAKRMTMILSEGVTSFMCFGIPVIPHDDVSGYECIGWAPSRPPPIGLMSSG
jgi:hypothetical protein